MCREAIAYERVTGRGNYWKDMAEVRCDYNYLTLFEVSGDYNYIWQRKEIIETSQCEINIW